MGPLKKDPHGRGGRVGEGGGMIDFVVFYDGLRLWEVRFVVFYEGLRLWGGSVSNQPVTEGGSAKERPSRAWGEREGKGWESLDLSCFTGV